MISHEGYTHMSFCPGIPKTLQACNFLCKLLIKVIFQAKLYLSSRAFHQSCIHSLYLLSIFNYYHFQIFLLTPWYIDMLWIVTIPLLYHNGVWLMAQWHSRNILHHITMYAKGLDTMDIYLNESFHKTNSSWDPIIFIVNCAQGEINSIK
jgi:hypothetical protein